MRSLHTLLVAVALVGPETPRRLDEPIHATPQIPDVTQLRELLYSRQQPQEQSQAALLLLQSAQPQASEVIRDGLRRWDRPDVFQALASAIRLRRDRRFVDPLLKALNSEQTPLRQSAAEALARLDSELVTNRLLGIAEDASAPLSARQAAVTALGRSGQKPAVLALLSLLSSDSATIREAAAASLEELTGQSFGANLNAWQAWWQHCKDRSEMDWLVGRAALASDRSRRLEQDLRRAEEEILRLHQALFSKVPLADRPSYLRSLVQIDYPVVRTQAVTWIVETIPGVGPAEQKQLAATLLLLSDDGVESVQRQAVLALEKLDDPQAFERLLVLVQSGSTSIRAAAARSLGRYRAGKTAAIADMNARAIAALEKALSDSSLNVVAEAVESLGSLGVPEAAPIVAGLLRHPSDAVRQAAARALEQVANAKVLAELYLALDDPVLSVRFSVVGALGRVGLTETLEEPIKQNLLQRLETVLVHDGDPGVRSRAATVLGDIGSPQQLGILWQRVIATEDNRVQVKAWTAMIDLLSRCANWSLVSQWDQTISAQKDPARRAELLTEVRNRWLKMEAAKPHLDPITAALVQAQLSQRKWSLAAPLALDLAKKATADNELQKRLRWLVVAGNQALDEKKLQEAQQILKDVEELLPRAGGELAAEFDLIRQRIAKSKDTQ